MFFIRHINPVKINPERITREDKKLVNDLDYNRVEFPVREKDFSKIEKKPKKNNICINVFCYENIRISCFFQFTLQIKNLKNR